MDNSLRSIFPIIMFLRLSFICRISLSRLDSGRSLTPSPAHASLSQSRMYAIWSRQLTGCKYASTIIALDSLLFSSLLLSFKGKLVLTHCYWFMSSVLVLVRVSQWSRDPHRLISPLFSLCNLCALALLISGDPLLSSQDLYGSSGSIVSVAKLQFYFLCSFLSFCFFHLLWIHMFPGAEHNYNCCPLKLGIERRIFAI